MLKCKRNKKILEKSAMSPHLNLMKVKLKVRPQVIQVFLVSKVRNVIQIVQSLQIPGQLKSQNVVLVISQTVNVQTQTHAIVLFVVVVQHLVMMMTIPIF